MKIGGKDYDQIVITSATTGRLITADDGKEVIAIISDDEKIVVKDGFEVRLIPAPKSKG